MKLSLARIAEFLGASGQVNPETQALGYSIDSRTVQPGELFFAVKGDRLDGHDFAEQALSRGAVAAVVRKDQLGRYANSARGETAGVGTGFQPVRSGEVQPASAVLLAVDDTLVALQTLATAVRKLWAKTAIGITATNFAFTLSGIDSGYHPVGYGGVLSISGTSITGTADLNDGAVAVFASSSTAGNLSGSVTSNPISDSYGRGTATFTITSAALPSSPTTLSLAFYVVGGEVVRIIDVDPETSTTVFGPAALGSLYGQGTNATGASDFSLILSNLGCVFGIRSNLKANNPYAAAGQIRAEAAELGTITSGEGDENGDGVTLEASPLGGSTYNIASNGYGSISLTGLGPVASLGLYMTDPKLNLIDPNNTSTEIAGGLILDMDAALSGGVGVVVPQTATGPTSTEATVSADRTSTASPRFPPLDPGNSTSSGRLRLRALL